MAFFQDAIDKVKDMANGFLNGRPSVAPRASYYASEEEANAYQQPVKPQPPEPNYQEAPYQGQAYQQPPQMNYPPQQPVYQPQPPQPRYRTQAGYADASYGYEQPQPQKPPQENNFSYFPNAGFQGPNGEKFVHVERVIQMISREGVHLIVTCMINRESVIVSCESIAGAQEVQRCYDMVAGAAYALNCQITQLSLTSKIFLVSPANVCVLCDEGSNRINGRGSDGSPLRARTRRTPGKSNDSYGYQEYDRGGEYQEYQEYQDYHEDDPYQAPRREGYGRPTYHSAAM